jgi:MarR family transcriptional regulator for hemolysin
MPTYYKRGAILSNLHNDDPPAPSIGLLLYDTARLMRRDFDRRARKVGLTRAQWMVISYLARGEGSNQAAIADFLDVEPITIVRHLDRLEEAGWIERRADPSDRRARLIYLTDKARPILATKQELGAETREVMLAGLSEQARDQLLGYLQHIRANLAHSLNVAVGPAANEPAEVKQHA